MASKIRRLPSFKNISNPARFERTIEFIKNKKMDCYLCKKSLTDDNGYQIGTVWSCEKCLDIVKQLVDEGRIKNEE